MSLQSLGEEVTRLRTEQKSFFDGHKNDKGELAMSAEEREQANKRNDDILKAQGAFETASADAALAIENEGQLARLKTSQGRITSDGEPGAPALVGVKSLGELFLDSDAMKGWKPSQGMGPSVVIDLAQFGKGYHSGGVKTLLDTSGFAPAAVRLPTLVTPGEQPPTVSTLMPNLRTTQNRILYMEETTTDATNVDTVAEAGPKLEVELAFTEQTANVVKIGASLPVTEEAFDDNAGLEDYVNSRLRAFVDIAEDRKLLNGTGGSDMLGILQNPAINDQPIGSDSLIDAIFKANTQVYLDSFLPADAFVINPADWQTIRLTREGSGGDPDEGGYLMGAPTGGAGQPWGLRPVLTTSIAQGTVLVGAFRLGAAIHRRADVTLRVGWIDDQFTHNLRTILVEERLALTVYRPSAFCTVSLGS